MRDGVSPRCGRDHRPLRAWPRCVIGADRPGVIPSVNRALLAQPTSRRRSRAAFGDVVEDWRAGRSASWLARQLLAAVALTIRASGDRRALKTVCPNLRRHCCRVRAACCDTTDRSDGCSALRERCWQLASSGSWTSFASGIQVSGSTTCHALSLRVVYAAAGYAVRGLPTIARPRFVALVPRCKCSGESV